MSHFECLRLAQEYADWLRSGFQAELIDGICEVITPFVDHHNDHLIVYIEPRGDRLVLTDDGHTLSDLAQSGVEMNTPKRQEELDTILRGLGIRLCGGELEVEAAQNGIPQKLHSLIQAMLAVNDMFITAQSRIRSFFLEDVRQFLQAGDIRFSENVKLPGRSGFDHAINFLIPASAARPERIVQAIGTPNRTNIASYLFALTDTRGARRSDAEAYAFLNDQETQVSGDVVSALDSYGVEGVVWSKREAVAEALAN